MSGPCAKIAAAPDSGTLGAPERDAFFAGGHVVSGAVTGVSSRPQRLLALPSETIGVSVVSTPGTGIELVITNDTGARLTAVQLLTSGTGADATTQTTELRLDPGDTTVPLGPLPGIGQLHIQMFPNGPAFPDVVTVIVCSEAPASAGPAEVVGQAFTGAI